jgi:hypothetical protein
MPTKLASNIPPITVVPMICRATDPAPEAVHSGTVPRMNANEVIRIGRKRSRAPSSAASTSGLPFGQFFVGELDNQNGVLGRQADEHDQADLRVDVVFDLHHVGGKIESDDVARRSQSTGEGAEHRHRRAQQTLSGSDQLSYSAARIRNTNSSENAKITEDDTPSAAFFSWNDMPE